MSFDLGFWYEDVPSAPERAAAIYERLTDGEEGVVPSASAVNDFFVEVIATFEDMTEENMEESPWTSPLYQTPECVVASLAYSTSGDVAPVLLELASKHGLTAYDPQNREVLSPARS